MNFYRKCLSINDNNSNKELIEHWFANLIISQLIRLCRLPRSLGDYTLYCAVVSLLNSKSFQQSLHFYRPKRYNSRVIPFLMNLRAAIPLILYCKFIAFKSFRKSAKNIRVRESDHMNNDEQIEIQIAINGTIYEANFGATTS